MKEKPKKEEREMKKPRKIRVEGPKYERLANELARDFAPEVHACKDCNHPVIEGFCCTFWKLKSVKEDGQQIGLGVEKTGKTFYNIDEDERETQKRRREKDGTSNL